MNNFCKYLLILVVVIPIYGQKPEEPSADAVVRQYNEFSAKQDWHGVSSLIHPDSLREFRSLLTSMLEKDREVVKTLFGVRSSTEFTALSDPQIFERLVGYINKASPDLSTALKSMEVAVIGSVEETPDLRHFVYRASFNLGPTPISSIEVYSLRRFQNTWRLLMKEGEMRAMASVLARLKPSEPATKPASVTPGAKRRVRRP